MNGKRKSTGSLGSNKKLKPANLLDEVEKKEEFENTIRTDLDAFQSVTCVQEAFQYLRSIFHRSHKLPPIFYQHQIYSTVENRTRVDREIEELKNSNQLRIFKCDSITEDIAICYTDDFKKHIREQLLDFEKETIKQIITNSKSSQGEFKTLIEKFQDQILDEIKDLSVSEFDLKSTYHLNEREITVLVQTGLLTIKNSSSWYFAIPFVGNFRRNLIEARRASINILKKKKFNELAIDELYRRNNKKINQIGIMYLVADLLGTESVRKVNSPIGFIIQLV